MQVTTQHQHHRQTVCIWVVVILLIIGFVRGIGQLTLILELSFCEPRIIDSCIFFCDIPKVIKLACMNIVTLGIVINADSGVLAKNYLILLLISYTCILVTPQLQSKDSSSMALSTCKSIA